MVMYANEIETKKKITWERKLTATYTQGCVKEGLSVFELFPQAGFFPAILSWLDNNFWENITFFTTCFSYFLIYQWSRPCVFQFIFFHLSSALMYF